MMLLFLLLLLIPIRYGLTIRGHEIKFELPHRRVLDTTPELWILHRNVTSTIPYVKLITKHIYLIWSTDYQNPLPGDKLGPWTLEMKGVVHPLELPILVHVSPGYVLPNAQRFGKDLWVLNNTVDESILASSHVIWVDKYRRIVMHSKEARMVHYPASERANSVVTGRGIIISSADTGIDTSHCSLFDPDHPIPTYNVITPSSHSKIASIFTAEPGITDYKGSDGAHGMATVGAAVGFNCGTNLIGTASGARIAFYDIAPFGTDEELHLPTESGPGVVTYYDYLENVIVNGGATVVSNSWGSDTNGEYDSVAATLDALAYKYPRVWFGFSVGNSYGTPASPGGVSKNIIGVGASFSGADAYSTTIWSDALFHPENYGTDCVADFSSHGPLSDGRIKPIIYSPGVYEFVPYGYYVQVDGHTHIVRYSGTSFSEPNIAGIVAHEQSKYKALHNGAVPLASLMTATLIAWSVPMRGTMQITSSGAIPIRTDQSNWYGYGTPTGISDGTSVEDSVSSLEVKSYCFRFIYNTSLVSIGLAWTDVPTEVPYTSKQLVNDLDLYVYVNQELTYASNDHVNPAERFRTDQTIMAGDTLRIIVQEADLSVQNGPQFFGLHVTNVLDTITTCGTCQSIDYETCTNGRRYCNPITGLFTSCLVRTTGVTGVSNCRGSNYDGILSGNTCTILTCDAGYYYTNNNQCTCIPGYRFTAQTVCDVTGTTYVTSLGATFSEITGQTNTGIQRTSHPLLFWFIVFVTQNIIVLGKEGI